MRQWWRLRVFWRILQVLGITLGFTGLAGYWLTYDIAREPPSDSTKERLSLQDDDFYVGFVVAGRDVFYGEGQSTPVYDASGRIVCWRYTGSRHTYGVNTDTILYVSITNNDMTLVLLPRDIFVGAGTKRLSSVYQTDGAAGLKEMVSQILDVTIDYYAIINLGIFQRLVDDLGGVEVNVPVRMYHRDCAADLTIDLQPGVQRLSGEQASHFVRYRNLSRGDIDRLENVKTLAYAMLRRLQELNVGAVIRLPELVQTVISDIETNVTPNAIRQLLLRVNQLSIRNNATLPTFEVTRDGTHGLAIDSTVIRQFMIQTYGGATDDAEATLLGHIQSAPDAILLITNRSGVSGLAEAYAERATRMGVPEGQLRTRDDNPDGSPTRLLTITDGWFQADDYTQLFQTVKQQVDRLPRHSGDAITFELILGDDLKPLWYTASAPLDYLASDDE